VTSCRYIAVRQLPQTRVSLHFSPLRNGVQAIRSPPRGSEERIHARDLHPNFGELHAGELPRTLPYRKLNVTDRGDPTFPTQKPSEKGNR